MVGVNKNRSIFTNNIAAIGKKLVSEHSVADLKGTYPVYSVTSNYTQLRQDQITKTTVLRKTPNQ